MKTLVVLPTYNERENLELIVDSILFPRATDLAVLIVDDASPDGTGDIADQLATRHLGKVFVSHRPGKLGLGSAYLEGFRFGLAKGFEALCEMDADGSHDPAQLLELIAEVERGADVVIGSRRIPGGSVEHWGLHRHVMSRGAMFLSRLALGLKTMDVTSGFRCYRARVVAELLLRPIHSNGYAFQEETLWYCEKLGFLVTEIPITFRDRKRGKSKLTWREAVQFFITVWKIRTRAESHMHA